jgi:hypothetical protein
MSDVEKPPPDDSDRDIDEDDLDPEAPTDSTSVHPPRDDADRPVPVLDEPEDAFQEENAGTSLDQPSDQI